MSYRRTKPLILIRGAGDLASGVAYRLHKAGFAVVMTELASPLAVRVTVSFCSCVRYQTVIIEGVLGQCGSLNNLPELYAMLQAGSVVVVVDPNGEARRKLAPQAVIDCRVAKTNLDTSIEDASLVVGVGPGFTAGVDCHAVVETNRGHHLGRVFWWGGAEADTGSPAAISGFSGERVLRAPVGGLFWGIKVVGNLVKKDDILGRIDSSDQPDGATHSTYLTAPFDGVVRGLIDDETIVTAGLKIGDLDPRLKRAYCFTLSDKSLAVGGGVLEAVLSKGIVSWADR
jgi:xanthine dehydrogenase accessory factor